MAAPASPWPFNPPAIPFNASQRLAKTITFGPATVSGTSSATAATTLTDAAASFTVDALIGQTVYSNGSSGVITTNSATVITITAWTGGTPTAVKPYMVGAAGIDGPMAVPVPIATVSGIVMVRGIIVHATTGLTDVGATETMGFGVTGNVGLFIPAAGSVAAQMITGNFWGPAGGKVGGIPVTQASSTVAMREVAIGANPIITIAGENIIGGVLDIYFYWDPISVGATLT